jgi:hypothetical protein
VKGQIFNGNAPLLPIHHPWILQCKCPNWLPIVCCIVHNDYVVPKVLKIVDDPTTQKLSSYPILQLPVFSPKG